MFAKLLVIAGPDKGRTFEAVPAVPMVIGRSNESDIRLADKRVSPVHCKLEVRIGQLFVVDLDSQVGTAVNNVFVKEYTLHYGDTLTVGDNVILIQDPDSPEVLGFGMDPPPPPNSRTNARVSTPAPKPTPKKADSDADAKPLADTGDAKSLTALSEWASVRAKAAGLPDRAEMLSGHAVGNYEVGEMIARGRSGFVFRATDRKNKNRVVALKILSAAYAFDQRNRNQFTKAMQLAIAVPKHPNVVPVINAGKVGPYCWLAMEFVQGESLTATIRTIGVASSLEWRRALRMSIHLAKGLNHLHEQRLVFRNIGPQNIMCEGEARIPRLTDFLRCRPFFDPIADQATGMDDLPENLLVYVAPEQTREELQIDHRSDIFNLGSLIYSLLSGQPPFEGGSLAETITKVRRERPTDPHVYQMAIPKAFEGVVLQMLAKRPENRYQTMAEVLRDLEKTLKYQGMTL